MFATKEMAKKHLMLVISNVIAILFCPFFMLLINNNKSNNNDNKNKNCYKYCCKVNNKKRKINIDQVLTE